MRTLRCILVAACSAAALAALPGVAAANVQVGSSGWEWGNPLPQGNTLRAMSFAGLRGYAAGDFGTLLATADGGTTWTGLRAGTFANLVDVQAVDGDTLVAGGGCVARRSDDGGTTFARIGFTPVESDCKESLVAMHFTTEANGFLLLADGTVLQTIDRGVEFAQKTSVPGTRSAGTGGNAEPTDISFITDAIGFASTSQGKIFQTTDAGNTWKPVSDTTRGVRGITFVDATNGYAVGDASLFLKTTDGGATWTPKDVGGPAPLELRQIRCAGQNLCVVATQKGDVLVRTADGGDTFTLPTPSTDPILTAAFASPTRLAAGGQSGATVVSDDGGQNFAPVGGRLTGRFSRIRAGLIPGTAFAPGADGALAKTVDGGKTWTRTNVSTSQDVLDVAFPTADIGYALDVQGDLFRTSSGGQTWRGLDTGTTADPFAVYATSGTTVMLIGPTGIRRSTDGGDSFETVRGGAVARTPLEGIDRAGSALVAWGNQAIVRSTDAGETWSAVRKPGRYVRRNGRLVNRLALRSVDFADTRTGFAVDAVGRVWRTRSGGRSWTELPGVGLDRGVGLSFSTARKGYLVIPSFGDIGGVTGFVLRTEDGGSTWHPQFVVPSPIPPLGLATGAGVDYLLGGESSLLFSTTGGESGGQSILSLTTQRRQLRKPARIRVTGKLGPASGGERVTVSWRQPGTTRWFHQTVKTGATGSFTTSWNVRRGLNTFVAQWQGDFRSQGDGSPTINVRVGRRR